MALGVQTVNNPRYISEYLPLSKYSMGIGFYTMSMNFGAFLALLSAVILPPDDDTDALKAD